MANLTTYELNFLIGKRADEKEEFRAALLSDPKKALEKEFAVVIPDNIKIELHEERKNTMHLIVPMSAKDTLDLTEDQLEQVSGGVSHNPQGMGVCTAYGVPGDWNFPKNEGSWFGLKLGASALHSDPIR